MEIIKEKDEEILFGSVNDSINNKADPIEIIQIVVKYI